MLTEVRINNIEDLIHQLNELPNHFIFRGQADASWSLESSLERTVGMSRWSKSAAQAFEDFSLQQFQSKFHLYDRENVTPSTKLAWLSVMQHYGVPTRLIDFTESPYIALYFALEDYSPLNRIDLAVFAIDYTATMEASLQTIREMDKTFHETRQSLVEKRDTVFDNVVDRFSHNIIWITEPNQLNARLDRQAGSFLMSGNNGARIEKLINLPVYNDVQMIKYIIDASLYTNVFALLRKMNITSKSLYGDLGGLAKSIGMEMRVRTV